MQPPGIILVNPKFPHNVAAAIRACSCFGVKSLVWTGRRVDPSKYDRLPREERMKGYSEVVWRNQDMALDQFDCGIPVCIEISRNSVPLTTFEHPVTPIYVFGPEDGGVPQVWRRLCHYFVHIPSRHCLNLAAALNVVLYDRATKLPPMQASVVDFERRGEIPVPGFDGQ